MSSRRLAILVIHGMGAQTPGYSEAMVREIVGRLPPGKATSIAWREVYWADVLLDAQNEYLSAARRGGNKLDYPGLRRFVVSALGDAAAYRRTDDDPHENTYEAIHRRVSESVEHLEERVAAGTPLIVIAHSLGGHIASNYIWDAQKVCDTTDGRGLTDFGSMRTLAGIVTFGCSIPLFVLAYEASRIRPIRFPGDRLPDWARPHARWLNFYDPNDVLGYPLKPINKAYAEVVAEDRIIHVGGLLSGWNPLSHRHYWTDGNFTRPVARFLESFL